MASIITRPNGSGQSIGVSSATAPLRNSDFSESRISPNVFDARTIDQGADLLIEIVTIHLVDLRRDLQRHAAPARDGDRTAWLRFNLW
jgi:hypothetical protein